MHTLILVLDILEEMVINLGLFLYLWVARESLQRGTAFLNFCTFRWLVVCVTAFVTAYRPVHCSEGFRADCLSLIPVTITLWQSWTCQKESTSTSSLWMGSGRTILQR